MEDGKYLKTKRIELDSLISAVGPQELWKFVMHQLNVKFPKNMTYDYTRVISDPIPSLADPDPVSDVTEYIEYIKDKAARPRWKEIVETDLQSVKDLIKVDDKKQEIDKELLDLIANYERMKKEIVPRFKKLKIELQIDSDEWH